MNIHSYKREIVKFLRKSRVITTSEVAEKFGISWNTAEKYLLELALDGIVLRIRKTGVNLWIMK